MLLKAYPSPVVSLNPDEYTSPSVDSKNRPGIRSTYIENIALT
ncbi:protein of unknown function [Shewanella benthica]|uniref:Uncharacterized protein n=1 Tax=Shewanella benthica TaxID=43661 RepID=A0A330M7U3_9GAMM|nr:protein of unknown function [Shewanella benthica]